ncbi:hypothetical protein MCC01947_07940 [Bifidobacteriaceae bacterium MCC01947]|nr:hypothetical protein BBMN23_0156 [Bifidobacterium adolescentis]GDY97519.1 hypothetical protein MCC01947_07940 [Bifidobacteriaceae bacterium MCC01947]
MPTRSAISLIVIFENPFSKQISRAACTICKRRASPMVLVDASGFPVMALSSQSRGNALCGMVVTHGF